MRPAAFLLCCLALTLAEKSSSVSKRGIGPEAFAPAKSQDTSSAFNLRALIGNQQLPAYSQGYGLQPDLSAYQSPYLGHGGASLYGGGAGLYGGGHINSAGYRIPPQTAPAQKPAQLALAAAAAVAQQNFGHPAYGAPPPEQPSPQMQAIQNLQNQLNSLPQYQEYGQQFQAFVRQPIALNYANTQIRAFPPPEPQPVQPSQPQAVSQPQVLGNTFQAAFDKGFQYGGFGYDAVLGNHLGDANLFRPAPPQVAAEAPQPAPVKYAAAQPGLQYGVPRQAPVKYSQPIPSYGLPAERPSFSYSSFASGEKEINSGFRPINPLYP
ncbi:chromatin modification-related protein eaf-1-like [Ischnura elegans]|uniref:chromatin modification-related protein eaf-1-like n=1 Tax=Ischnura elegans TaxID=197161 RepID=UPI001ED86650|nr:chromatin modification-related protein eaf-1-like [Ischnura elegans]